MIKVQFVLPEDLHRRLRQAAQQQGVSMSQFVREALEQALADKAEARKTRRRRVLAKLREISQRLATQAPDLMYTPEDLHTLREEWMNEHLGNH
nr:ribbon-helix-helix protein, CopG family [Ardenticatena sp.]